MMHGQQNIKFTIALVRFQRNFNFIGRYFEKYIKVMKIRQVGVDLFHVDGQTDRQT
jgi:hypothetical protein